MMIFLILMCFQETAVDHPAQQWLSQRRAVGALVQTDPEKAYQGVESLMAAQPGSPQTRLYTALLAMQTGRNARALEVLQGYADAGMVFNPERFVGLKDVPGYANIIAQLTKNREAQCSGKLSFEGEIPGFFAEGIAHDKRDGSFYMGSVHYRRIVKRLPDGSFVDFVTAGRDGLMSVLGMEVDEKRDLLWVASSGLDQSRELDPDLKGRSGLFAFEIKTARLKHKIMLEGQAHNLGDLAIASNGTIYATDTSGNALYRLAKGADKLEKVLETPWFRSPQGLTLSKDEKRLYVADYTFGLFVVDLDSMDLKQLTTNRPMVLSGIDGLERYGNRLIAIQNGTNPHRVISWELNASGDRIVSEKVLCQNQDAFDEPTLGVLVDDTFYFVANSQWGRYTKDHRPIKENLAAVQVYEIQL